MEWSIGQIDAKDHSPTRRHQLKQLSRFWDDALLEELQEILGDRSRPCTDVSGVLVVLQGCHCSRPLYNRTVGRIIEGRENVKSVNRRVFSLAAYLYI